VAWLASAAAALYLTGRSAWQLTHDPGQRARYRSRGEMLGRRAGIAVALPASDGYVRRIGFSPWPPLVILALMEAIASLSLLV
jgi:hypothetical protein